MSERLDRPSLSPWVSLQWCDCPSSLYLIIAPELQTQECLFWWHNSRFRPRIRNKQQNWPPPPAPGPVQKAKLWLLNHACSERRSFKVWLVTLNELDTKKKKKTRVTVWTQCGYQSEKTSRHVIRLSRSAEGISTEESHSLWACQRLLPITGWTAKGWWDSSRLVTINFSSPSYFLF